MQNYITVEYAVYFLCFLMAVYAVILLFDYQKYNILLNGKAAQSKHKAFSSIIDELDFFIEVVGLSKRAEFIRISLLVLILASFVYPLSQKMGVISLFIPFLIFVTLKFLFKFSYNILNNKLNKTLPDLIDMTYRIMTRNGNLRYILYEVSVNYQGFLKEPIVDLVLEMETRTEVDCIAEFSKKFSNMYLRSYCILLTSFVTKSKKEDVMENLKLLGETIRLENKMKKEILSEKMGTSVQNWFLTGGAIIAFLANLRMNPDSATFFFQSYQGLMCLIIGFGCIFATILFNVKSMS